MKIKPFLFCIILFFSAISGCQVFFDTSDNISRIFTETGRVKNKIKDPVRKDVKLSALWIGHATVLLQMDDKVILTDPWLTDYCAELQKRVVEPGLNIDVLKKCDLILISHSHFDHLNLGTLSILEKQFPGIPLVFPQGLEDFIPDMNFKLMPFKRPDRQNKIYKGETKTVNGIKITTVAAYHWGGRYGFDGLFWGFDAYCGFIIEYNGMTVYFAGDTAYDENFYKYLGENYNIDVEFIPIGPCKDCEKVDKKNRHVYPKGALKILDDSKAAMMIPIHYGTIAELSDPMKPKYVLMDMIRNNKNYSEKVKILDIGGQIIIR